MPAAVTVTYYLEILSSWCHWAEPAWRELQQRYASRVDFRWRIALMSPDAFPVSAAQTDWFYQRSGTIMRSPRMLHSGWFEPARQGQYEAPNQVAEAGRDFLGEADDRLRLALTRAALLEGRRVGDLALACEIGAAAVGIDATALREAAESEAVRSRLQASTAAFAAHQLNQRPGFVLEDAIGDKAVFSGLVRVAPLATTIDAMLDDCAAYAAHAAHFGPPPSV
jgi:predicted DsbA family dithiol-disulfide isomerase